MIKDLVCGMEIGEKTAGYSMNFEGEMLFFCSEGCQAEFKRHPQDYLTPADSSCCGKPSGQETLEEERLDV